MKEKAKEFLDEFKELCVKHKMMITASDYGYLEIWGLDDGEEPFDLNRIDDFTK